MKRDWIVGLGGLALAAMTAWNSYSVGRVDQGFSAGVAFQAQKDKDEMQDKEIAAVGSRINEHMVDAKARIPEHDELVRDFKEMKVEIREIHDFLVRRFQMPTALPLSPEPDGGGLYAAELPEKKPGPSP